MSLREKIADIVVSHTGHAMNGLEYSETDAADAILSIIAKSVPPLVWNAPTERHLENGVCHGSCERIAYVNDGHLHWYRIYPTGRNEWRWVEQFRMTYIGGNEADDPPLFTAESAMAAAQSDYTSRVLKAVGIGA